MQQCIQIRTYDTYQWYLDLGPLSNVNAKYLHGSLSFWNEVIDHPDYDAYWKKEAWVRLLHGSSVPLLNVAGSGIKKILGVRGKSSGTRRRADPSIPISWSPAPGITVLDARFERRRNWAHPIGWPGYLAAVSRDDRSTIFSLLPARIRAEAHVAGDNLPDWLQCMADLFGVAPKNVEPKNLYLHSDGTLSFEVSVDHTRTAAYREYVSDPANPVPYRQRPISPISQSGEWPIWEVSDQRFAEHRPDVLTYVSARLGQDVVVSGAISAELFASTSARMATSSSS